MLQVKASGAQPLVGGNAPISDEVQAGTRVEDAKVSREELEAGRGQLLGLGEQDDSGHPDLGRHERSLRVGVFVDQSAGPEVFHEGPGVDQGDKAVQNKPRVLLDFMDQRPWMSAPGSFDDDMIEIVAMLPGIQNR